jgi:hypothetical protein
VTSYEGLSRANVRNAQRKKAPNPKLQAPSSKLQAPGLLPNSKLQTLRCGEYACGDKV